MKHPTRIEQEAMAEAYEGGLSREKVALKFGRSQEVVSDACRACGVEMRSRGGGNKHRVDHARLARLIEMRGEGAKLEEMGAEFKITRERVRQILAKAGVDTSSETRPLNKVERSLVEAYVKGGGNLYYFADRAGVCVDTFRRWLARSGHVPKRYDTPRQEEVMKRAQRTAQLYKEGALTTEGIAKEVGLPHSTAVYRDLARAGVKPDRAPWVGAMKSGGGRG